MRSAPGQKFFDGRKACQRCGRTLKGEKSIEIGYGATCFKKSKATAGPEEEATTKDRTAEDAKDAEDRN